MNNFIFNDVIYRIIANTYDADRDALKRILLTHLSEEERNDYEAVISGKKLPSFMSDIVAKKLFDADEHKDRLEYLFREVSGDNTIVVDASFRNEGYIQSTWSKKMIYDITAQFHDGRIGDAEFQVSAQQFTFERTEIYGSDLLMLQYSVNPGQKKSELSYDNVKGVLLVFLMKNSPSSFNEYKSEHYIHRFKEHKADSGLTCTPLVQKIYVQLDKCLEQFLEGKDGENNQQLQILLSLLADSGKAKVLDAAQQYPMFKDMIDEAKMFAQNKEVQAMLLAEKYAEADFNARIDYERNQSTLKLLYELVRDGDMTVQKAAKKANVTVEDFERNMTLLGYKNS